MVQNEPKLNTQMDKELLSFTQWDNTPVSFNQGVAGSRPARPTKARKPTLLRYSMKNQGVKTLGQPTP